VVDSDIAFDERPTSHGQDRGPDEFAWQWERGVGSRQFSLPTQAFEFGPDRSRSAWREIPVAIPGPFSERTEVTVLLPKAASTTRSKASRRSRTEVAGVRMIRQTGLDETS
jgi:hypothetical protein